MRCAAVRRRRIATCGATNVTRRRPLRCAAGGLVVVVVRGLLLFDGDGGAEGFEFPGEFIGCLAREIAFESQGDIFDELEGVGEGEFVEFSKGLSNLNGLFADGGDDDFEFGGLFLLIVVGGRS